MSKIFLSYWHKDEAWAQTLYDNLQAALGERIIFARLDLRSGQAWPDWVARGIQEAEQAVMLMTPEAACAYGVQEEETLFVNRHRDWLPQGRVHLAVHWPTEPPPFLAGAQRVDFTDHGRGTYTEAFQTLLAGLTQASGRVQSVNGQELELPGPGYPRLPIEIVKEFAGLLAAPLISECARRALCLELGLGFRFLERFSEEARPRALFTGYCMIHGTLKGARQWLAFVREDRRVDGALEDQLTRLEAELQERPALIVQDAPFERYRQRLKTEHNRLVPFLADRLPGRGRSDIHVELDVAMARDAEHLALRGTEDRVGIDELISLWQPSRDAALGPRWMVRGDPGCGKTTLLREYAFRQAKHADGKLPIFLRAHKLVDGQSGRDDAWARVRAALEAEGQDPGFLKELERLRDAGQLVLMLDGLDEVGPKDLKAVRAQIESMSKDFMGASSLIVTCRKIGYERLETGFETADVRRLAPDSQAELLDKYAKTLDKDLGERTAEQWVAYFAQKPTLRQFAENPLLLTMMALLIVDGQTPSEVRIRLYEDVIDLFLTCKHRGDREAIPCQANVRMALSAMAERMTRAGKIGARPEELETYILGMKRGSQEQQDCLEDLQAWPAWSQGLSALLNDIAERTGLLADYDGRQEPWRFWHRSFQEALTTQYLGTLSQEELLRRAGELDQHLDLWAEPFALLCGKLASAEADRLILDLAKVNEPLALRALASAQNVSPDTVAQLLKLEQDGKQEERGAILQKIPILIGDVERSLTLLERLRKESDVRSDLYFIGETLDRIADQHPRFSELAGRLKGELFDHLPRPEGPLFETVETCAGRVDLWRDCPPGGEGLQLFAVTVTNEQYKVFDPSFEIPKGEGPKHPAVTISWYGATAFCAWLGGRLPTEEEWELACRAGTKTQYWSGDGEKALARVGWYTGNSGRRRHSVGELPANDWGLHDVHGNVWEWCSDESSGGSLRALSGGSCWDVARSARSAYRVAYPPSNRYGVIGFRPARVHP